MNSLSPYLVIIVMAMVTYFTRLFGYFFLKNKKLSPKMNQMLEMVPGCVLLSVIAPAFTTGNPADLIALIFTIIIASRFKLLTTVVLSVIVTGGLRYLLQLFS